MSAYSVLNPLNSPNEFFDFGMECVSEGTVRFQQPSAQSTAIFREVNDQMTYAITSHIYIFKSRRKDKREGNLLRLEFLLEVRRPGGRKLVVNGVEAFCNVAAIFEVDLVKGGFVDFYIENSKNLEFLFVWRCTMFKGKNTALIYIYIYMCVCVYVCVRVCVYLIC